MTRAPYDRTTSVCPYGHQDAACPMALRYGESYHLHVCEFRRVPLTDSGRVQ